MGVVLGQGGIVLCPLALTEATQAGPSSNRNEADGVMIQQMRHVWRLSAMGNLGSNHPRPFRCSPSSSITSHRITRHLFLQDAEDMALREGLIFTKELKLQIEETECNSLREVHSIELLNFNFAPNKSLLVDMIMFLQDVQCGPCYCSQKWE